MGEFLKCDKCGAEVDITNKNICYTKWKKVSAYEAKRYPDWCLCNKCFKKLEKWMDE